jgi:hypothetical protein
MSFADYGPMEHEEVRRMFDKLAGPTREQLEIRAAVRRQEFAEELAWCDYKWRGRTVAGSVAAHETHERHERSCL